MVAGLRPLPALAGFLKSVLRETVQGLRKSHMRHMGHNSKGGHILAVTLSEF